MEIERGDGMQYIIKLKEEPLISFTVSSNHFGEYEIKDEQVITPNKNILPKGIQHGIKAWITSRVIPKNRQNVKDVLGY